MSFLLLALGHTFGGFRGFKRFKGFKGFWKRVLKFDGLSGRGLWIAPGNAYKVSVTGLAFYVIWHDRHSADWLAALASPYPAAPDFPLFRHCYLDKRIHLNTCQKRHVFFSALKN